MYELAKILKSFGSKYSIEWKMDYFGPEPCLMINLRYFDAELNMKLQHQYQIPFNHLEDVNQHGPQILLDMHKAMREKIMEAWSNL